MRFRWIITMFLPVVLFTATTSAQLSFHPSKQNRSVFVPAAHSSNQDSVAEFIVEFKEMPLFIAQTAASASASVFDHRSRFRQFESDLRVQMQTAAVGGRSVSIQTHREFYKSFFGMSITAPAASVAVIEQLPYVKKVHRNRPVKAYLQKSLQQIRATEVWANAGVQGEGVVVGIIDTGIDYMHAALGGGLGSTFKVIGGYDFHNDDADPMDDNGHGTHVAGIVAADAVSIKGVAPKSKLYAFKVLGAEGGGKEDDVIAAIERTVDPNNDGNMNDKLHIVNMSLGSSDGDPDDAGSVAVDNAVKLGVTFVIAAGNEGDPTPVSGKENNYFYSGKETIGSPGTARLAITVGAVDSVNKTAYFSSKGPTPRYYGIKPEVVAPGVSIRSLAPGNEYLIESGTSMASPMIAGVAALLKSKYSTLTPQQIKSAIVNSSVDLGIGVMEQGAGRVDAMRAVSAASFAEPSQISFGLDDPSVTTWTKVETVKVVNARNVQQNYSVTFSGQKSGVTISSVPQNFTLAAGAVQQLLVTVSVNNTVIPIVDEDIILHDGFVHVKGASDTLHLPWSFARTTRMLLTFSEGDVRFVGSSFTNYLTPFYNKLFSRIYQLDSKTFEVTGANREQYDFAVYFRNSSKLVVKSELQFNGADNFSFNAADAVHAVNFKGVDDQNIPLTNSTKTQRVMRVNLPFGFLFAQLNPGVSTLFISSAPNSFSFSGSEALIDPLHTKRVVLPQYPAFSGISSAVDLTNTAGEYYHQKLQFTLPSGISSTRMFTEVISTTTDFGETYFNTSIVGTDTIPALNEQFSFDLYLMKQKDAVFGNSVGFHTNNTYAKDFLLDMSTRYFSIVNDSVMHNHATQNWFTSYRSPSGGTMRFGESPVYVLNLSYNNSFGTSIHFNPIYHGGLGEQRFADVNSGTYTIYNSSGTVLAEEPLNNFPRQALALEPAKYQLVLRTGNYKVANAHGKLTLINNVDLTKDIPDAPVFTSFRLLNGQKRQGNNYSKNENASIQFSSKIFAYPMQLPNPDSARVYYRPYKSTQWIQMPVSSVIQRYDDEGTVFTASLAPATAVDSVAIDLKIRVVDSTGNSTEQILSPAFSVGNWIDDGSTPVDEQPGTIPAVFTLYQNYPNPFNPSTTIRYAVPTTGRVRLSVYDILGREVKALVDEVMGAGEHAVQFNGADLSSGIYFYRLTAGTHTALKKMIFVK